MQADFCSKVQGNASAAALAVQSSAVEGNGRDPQGCYWWYRGCEVGDNVSAAVLVGQRQELEQGGLCRLPGAWQTSHQTIICLRS